MDDQRIFSEVKIWVVKILELLLCAIAFLVFMLLARNHTAPWIVIAVYWAVLTVKNFLTVVKRPE